jgi:hypothetical protein
LEGAKKFSFEKTFKNSYKKVQKSKKTYAKGVKKCKNGAEKRGKNTVFCARYISRIDRVSGGFGTSFEPPLF